MPGCREVFYDSIGELLAACQQTAVAQGGEVWVSKSERPWAVARINTGTAEAPIWYNLLIARLKAKTVGGRHGKKI